MTSKILFINKYYNTGGAGIAAARLRQALIKTGAQVNFLAQEQTSSRGIEFTSKGFLKNSKQWQNFVIERLYFLRHEKDKSVRYMFSPAISGENIVNHKLLKEADIIHLHWFNQGYISLSGLHKILKLNKPVVWTLHDMWAFTGGCHYSGDCRGYINNCGNCPLLKNPSTNDLSFKHLLKKRAVYADIENLHFVTCSNWLKTETTKSTLLKDFPVHSIPNPIDTDTFKPISKELARKDLNLENDKKYILFGAANIKDKRKGFQYLADALHNFARKKGEAIEKYEILIFGKSSGDATGILPMKTHYLGKISSGAMLNKVYNSANIFVLPSLEDNLPNTIMEALSCGIPCVAFNSGGIPEMVKHKTNGCLAETKSSQELEMAIDWAIENEETLSKEARNHVLKNYSEMVVAENYLQLYNSIIKNDG